MTISGGSAVGCGPVWGQPCGVSPGVIGAGSPGPRRGCGSSLVPGSGLGAVTSGPAPSGPVGRPGPGQGASSGPSGSTGSTGCEPSGSGWGRLGSPPDPSAGESSEVGTGGGASGVGAGSSGEGAGGGASGVDPGSGVGTGGGPGDGTGSGPGTGSRAGHRTRGRGRGRGWTGRGRGRGSGVRQTQVLLEEVAALVDDVGERPTGPVVDEVLQVIDRAARLLGMVARVVLRLLDVLPRVAQRLLATHRPHLLGHTLHSGTLATLTRGTARVDLRDRPALRLGARTRAPRRQHRARANFPTRSWNLEARTPEDGVSCARTSLTQLSRRC